MKEAVAIVKRVFSSIMLIAAFILGTKDGFIALWREGEHDPIKVFPYSITSVPRKDQDALKKGIRIESQSDLIQMIEDYLS